MQVLFSLLHIAYYIYQQKHACNESRKKCATISHRTSEKTCFRLFQHIHYQMDINLIDVDKRALYVAKKLIKRLQLITAHDPLYPNQ